MRGGAMAEDDLNRLDAPEGQVSTLLRLDSRSHAELWEWYRAAEKAPLIECAGYEGVELQEVPPDQPDGGPVRHVVLVLIDPLTEQPAARLRFSEDKFKNTVPALLELMRELERRRENGQ